MSRLTSLRLHTRSHIIIIIIIIITIIIFRDLNQLAKKKSNSTSFPRFQNPKVVCIHQLHPLHFWINPSKWNNFNNFWYITLLGNLTPDYAYQNCGHSFIFWWSYWTNKEGDFWDTVYISHWLLKESCWTVTMAAYCTVGLYPLTTFSSSLFLSNFVVGCHFSTRHEVAAFPTTECHCPLVTTKLYCFVTEYVLYVSEQLAQSCYMIIKWRELNTRPLSH